MDASIKFIVQWWGGPPYDWVDYSLRSDTLEEAIAHYELLSSITDDKVRRIVKRSEEVVYPEPTKEVKES